jgi:hypothetical protein
MNKETIIIEEPAISRRLFADARLTWLWLRAPSSSWLALIGRWWHKFIHPKWMNYGQALFDYCQRGFKGRQAGDLVRWGTAKKLSHR